MPATVYNRVIGDVTPLPDHILVVNMEQGERVTKGGIVLADDNGKDAGIRPRWCQVYKTGRNIDYVVAGQWVLVEHGRWTYGISAELPECDEGESFHLQRIEPEAILLVADDKPF